MTIMTNIYNDNPKLYLDFRKPVPEIDTTVYYIKGDKGYSQIFDYTGIYEADKDSLAGFTTQLIVAFNGYTRKYPITINTDDFTNQFKTGSFAIPQDLTQDTGQAKAYIQFSNGSQTFTSPKWKYNILPDNDDATSTIPIITLDQVKKDLQDQIDLLKKNGTGTDIDTSNLATKTELNDLQDKVNNLPHIDVSNFVSSTDFNNLSKQVDKNKVDILTNATNITALSTKVDNIDISKGDGSNIDMKDYVKTTDFNSTLSTINTNIADNKNNIDSLTTKVNDIKVPDTSSFVNIDDFNTQIKEAEDKITDAQKGIANNAASITTGNDNLTNYKTSNDKAVADLTTKINDIKVPDTSNFVNNTDFNTFKQANNSQIEQNSQDITSNIKSIKDLNTKVDSNSTNIDKNTTDITALSTKVDNIDISKGDGSNIDMTDYVKTTDYNTKITDLDSSIATNKQNIDSLTTKVNDIQVPDTSSFISLKDFTDGSNKLQNYINTNTTNIATNKKSIDDLTTKVNDIVIPDTSNFATKSDVNNQISGNNQEISSGVDRQIGYALQDTNNNISNNTTAINDLTTKVDNIKMPDTSNFATKSDVNKNTQDIANNLTAITNNTNDIKKLSTKVDNINNSGSGDNTTVSNNAFLTLDNKNDIDAVNNNRSSIIIDPNNTVILYRPDDIMTPITKGMSATPCYAFDFPNAKRSLQDIKLINIDKNPYTDNKYYYLYSLEKNNDLYTYTFYMPNANIMFTSNYTNVKDILVFESSGKAISTPSNLNLKKGYYSDFNVNPLSLLTKADDYPEYIKIQCTINTVIDTRFLPLQWTNDDIRGGDYYHMTNESVSLVKKIGD